MVKGRILEGVVCAFLVLSSSQIMAIRTFDDGESHSIRSPISDSYVVVSADGVEQTSVYLYEGGEIDYLRVNDLCTVTINDSEGIGGNINQGLELWDYSNGYFWKGGHVSGQVLMQGDSRCYLRDSIFDLNGLSLYENSMFEIQAGSGTLETSDFFLNDHSSATILGGSVSSNVFTLDDYSRMDVLGGNITGSFTANGSSFLIFDGGGFKLDGQSLPGGDYKSLGTGRLTGVLRDGSLLDVQISIIDEAWLRIDETIVPEPATLVLMFFGAMLIRKK